MRTIRMSYLRNWIPARDSMQMTFGTAQLSSAALETTLRWSCKVTGKLSRGHTREFWRHCNFSFWWHPCDEKWLHSCTLWHAYGTALKRRNGLAALAAAALRGWHSLPGLSLPVHATFIRRTCRPWHGQWVNALHLLLLLLMKSKLHLQHALGSIRRATNLVGTPPPQRLTAAAATTTLHQRTHLTSHLRRLATRYPCDTLNACAAMLSEPDRHRHCWLQALRE